MRGQLLEVPAGNDLLFDESLCEQGRNFCNKIWNAFRLVKGWETTDFQSDYHDKYGEIAHKWMESRINESLESIGNNLSKFRI